jgi:hypothetical protein
MFRGPGLHRNEVRDRRASEVICESSELGTRRRSEQRLGRMPMKNPVSGSALEQPAGCSLTISSLTAGPSANPRLGVRASKEDVAHYRESTTRRSLDKKPMRAGTLTDARASGPLCHRRESSASGANKPVNADAPAMRDTIYNPTSQRATPSGLRAFMTAPTRARRACRSCPRCSCPALETTDGGAAPPLPIMRKSAGPGGRPGPIRGNTASASTMSPKGGADAGSSEGPVRLIQGASRRHGGEDGAAVAFERTAVTVSSRGSAALVLTRRGKQRRPSREG